MIYIYSFTFPNVKLLAKNKYRIKQKPYLLLLQMPFKEVDQSIISAKNEFRKWTCFSFAENLVCYITLSFHVLYKRVTSVTSISLRII